jgi:hypothetical protein
MKLGQVVGNWIGGAALLLAAVPGSAVPTRIPAPGTVNYVEGQVAVNGRNVTAGTTNTTQLGVNQTLDTGQGKAELLLTPGVFFRLGENSEVRMVSPGLADTEVALVKGSAMLEAAGLYKENNLSIQVDGAKTKIEKNGLYGFNADQPSVNVLDGEATVWEGDSHITLKKGHEVLLASGQPFKSEKLSEDAAQADSLYRWSKLRSEYEAEANYDTARTVIVNGGWYGPGWYWDPYWSFYAFLPGSGYLYSPFGWGFYSPWAAWYGPGFHGYPGVYGRSFGGVRGFRGAPAGGRVFAGGAHGFGGGGHGFGGGVRGGGGHR